MIDYRQMAVDTFGAGLVEQAEATGVPVPFWEIGGRVTTLDGTVQIAAQFATRPGDDVPARIRDDIKDLIGPRTIADDLSVSICWNPYAWEGHTR